MRKCEAERFVDRLLGDDISTVVLSPDRKHLIMQTNRISLQRKTILQLIKSDDFAFIKVADNVPYLNVYYLLD